MPPKGQQGGKGGKGNPAVAKAADKTFGMKNKGKSKAVQQIMKQAQGAPAANAAPQKDKASMQKDAARAALDSLLFQEAVKKPKKKEVKEEKKEVVVVEEPEPTELVEKIEWQRARVKTRTPVTLERLEAWLKAKNDAKAAAESSKLGNAKQQLQHGKKVAGLTGRDLFSVDPNLFVDDAEAVEDKLDERVATDDESDGEEGDGDEDRAPTSSAPSKSNSKKNADRVDLVIGERVKAKYMGGKFWYEGVVTDVHADGSACIEYEDGDVESNIPRKSIELLEREPRKIEFVPEEPLAKSGVNMAAASAAAATPAAAASASAATTPAASPAAPAAPAPTAAPVASNRTRVQSDANAKGAAAKGAATKGGATKGGTKGAAASPRQESVSKLPTPAPAPPPAAPKQATASVEPAVIDLENVDESLFLGEDMDLPDVDDV